MAVGYHRAVQAAPRVFGAMAVVLLSLAGACFPNPDDLRGGVSGSGGFPGAAGFSGAAGGHLGTGGAGGGMTTQCGVPACGGNLLGTWSFVNGCLAATPGPCAGEVFDASAVHRTGTITFNAAGTFSTTETDTGTFTYDFPTACLNGTTCADLQSGYQGAGYVGAPNPTLSSATCTVTSTGCRCLLGALPTPGTSTGSYVANGSSVTLTSSAGVIDADTYCVQGSILHLIYSTGTPTAPDEAVFAKSKQ